MVVHFVLVAMARGIALAWLLKMAEAAVGLRTVPDLLAAEYDTIPVGEPAVAVIVPARNEAAGVGACVESLVRQDYARLRVIAVDDRSTDGTGEILDGLARRHGERVDVLHVETLPEGWLGKTHAMALAARQAMEKHGCEYLLFTDGDVVFGADAVRRALAMACAEEADHLVVLPTTLVKTWGEGMLLAYLQVMAVWVVRIWRVADAKAKRDAIGVGAFNLMRAEAYRALGGFEAMPMEIVEDLTLGRRVKKAGMCQRIAIAPGTICVHWAAGVRDSERHDEEYFRGLPLSRVEAGGGGVGDRGGVPGAGWVSRGPRRARGGADGAGVGGGAVYAAGPDEPDIARVCSAVSGGCGAGGGYDAAVDGYHGVAGRSGLAGDVLFAG